jgi:hypothetical protein
MRAPLTEKQVEFARVFALNGGDATAAAVAAGYSESSARDMGRRTAALPHVADAILRELMHLRASSGAIGLAALTRIAQSTTAPAAAVVAAGRALCEHAGLLGTAKELREARERAADSANVASYTAVLDALAKLPASNDDHPPDPQHEWFAA